VSGREIAFVSYISSGVVWVRQRFSEGVCGLGTETAGASLSGAYNGVDSCAYDKRHGYLEQAGDDERKQCVDCWDHNLSLP
jgi:hypothetical protein